MVLQKYQKKFEDQTMRYVDDFSDDGTWEWMNSVCLLDPNVKIHRNEDLKD